MKRHANRTGKALRGHVSILRVAAARLAAAGIAALCLAAACLTTALAPALAPALAQANELAKVDSAAWCVIHAPGQKQACLRAESECRAALPDMPSAGGCPDRRLEACVVSQGANGSLCAILCCFDPDNPACRSAMASMPNVIVLPDS